MNTKTVSILISLVMGLLLANGAQAAPGQPDFSAALYGDGEVWGTKATTELPAPNENNTQSFDKLFVILNGAAGQLPVSEAAPGNPNYNGGRWFTHTTIWTEEGMQAHNNDVPVLRSYAEIMEHYLLGHLAITPGSFMGGPPTYFQCPLLPVK